MNYIKEYFEFHEVDDELVDNSNIVLDMLLEYCDKYSLKEVNTDILRGGYAYIYKNGELNHNFKKFEYDRYKVSIQKVSEYQYIYNKIFIDILMDKSETENEFKRDMQLYINRIKKAGYEYYINFEDIGCRDFTILHTKIEIKKAINKEEVDKLGNIRFYRANGFNDIANFIEFGTPFPKGSTG